MTTEELVTELKSVTYDLMSLLEREWLNFAVLHQPNMSNSCRKNLPCRCSTNNLS